MNIIDDIIDKKEWIQIIEIENMRYHSHSFILAKLSFYALNKEKNACKPNFEDLFLEDIMTLLHSEIKELQEEVNKEKIDYRRMLEEIADNAAVLVGMTAHIMHKINKQKKES